MDFQDTFDLVEGIQFDAAYIFKYSPRPKTEASKIADDVSKEEKEKRHRLILSLQKEISKKVKNKKSKVKSAIQNLKFLLLICIFYFFLLSFSLPAYALNIDKVKIYFLNADYKQAVSEAEKILVSSKDFSGLDELYYILGLSYLKEGNYLRAADIFEIILKDFKNSKFREEAEIGLADSYFLRGNFSQAKNYYQNFISTRPNSKFKPEVYSRLSKAETEKNNTNFYYSVQVGSFSNNINARNFAEELTQKAYPAFIEEIKNSEGKIIYRVKVGKLPRQKDAKELEKKLSKEGYPTKICP
jgi:TolA-binding protein